MKLPDYAAWAETVPMRASVSGDGEKRAAYLALGLAGDAGEAPDLVKKLLRDGRPLDPARLADELGDVAYYWVRLCTLAGVGPEEVLARSQAKIAARVS